MLPAVVGGVTALQEVRVLIPRTCEHVNLHGQRGIGRHDKGIHLDFPGGPNDVITGGLCEEPGGSEEET